MAATRIQEQLIGKLIDEVQKQIVEAGIKGRAPKSPMVSIHEGVLERDEYSSRFEAAIHTDEGPKTLQGTIVGEVKQQPDLQSGPFPEWESSVHKIRQAIRFYSAQLQASEAARRICQVWENLDKTSQLAEARTRICLGKLDEPELAECPSWLADQLPELSQPEEGLTASHPLAIEAAGLLIRACLQATAVEIEATVQKAPLGNVLVDWDVGSHSLQWEVEAARLPWPGVKVNALVVDNSGEKPQANTRIFHTAFEVVEHFREQLHGFGVQTGLH